MGSIVPIRTFGGAVQRNYARRRLREFYRRNKSLFPENTDILIRLYTVPSKWDGLLLQISGMLKTVKTKRETLDSTSA